MRDENGCYSIIKMQTGVEGKNRDESHVDSLFR